MTFAGGIAATLGALLLLTTGGCASPSVERARRAAAGPVAPLPSGPPAGAGPVESPPVEVEPPLVEVEAHVIAVDGRDVVGLRERADAAAVVEEIRAAYRQALERREGGVMQDARFAESVEVHRRSWPAARLRTREEARRILLRGTDKVILHTVQRGDSLWSIAQARRMDVDDLARANPDADPERLQPGQQLNLVVAQPFLTLRGTILRSYVENVDYPIEEQADPDRYPWESDYAVRGAFGKREVVELVRYEGMRAVGREVVSARLLSPPRKAIFRRGTKLAPQLGSGRFRLPIGGELTSGFGPRDGGFHTGIDLAAEWGAAVRAADAGTVVEAGWRGGYGYAVRIDHGGGELVTLYAHLSQIDVEVGERVKQGQVIGRLGSTGWSTGPHLHFEVQRRGEAVNPIQFFPR